MLLIPCPWCGPRAENEFRYAGAADVVRPSNPAAVQDADWAVYLYYRTNPRGRHTERWQHRHGCGRFFNCVRDTVTDRIAASYKQGEAAPS